MTSHNILTRIRYRYVAVKENVFISVLLLFLIGMFWPTATSAKTWNPWNGNEKIKPVSDTLETAVGLLPLSRRRNGYSRPRFETVHLQFGLGAMFANFSDLDHLGVNKSGLSLPLSLYTYVPFQRTEPGFFLLGGADLDLFDAGNFAFKMLLLYQTKPRILFGIGAGRTEYNYQDEIIIEASQTQGLLALGINLSPQRVDLLLTVPIASRLKTRFEQKEYSIRPAGIQVSLLVSLR